MQLHKNFSATHGLPAMEAIRLLTRQCSAADGTAVVDLHGGASGQVIAVEKGVLARPAVSELGAPGSCWSELGVHSVACWLGGLVFQDKSITLSPLVDRARLCHESNI